MLTPRTVLIRLGRGYSPVGTALVERDPDTGRRLWHLRLCATANEIFIPLDDDPAPAAQLDPDADPRLADLPAGHA